MEITLKLTEEQVATFESERAEYNSTFPNMNRLDLEPYVQMRFQSLFSGMVRQKQEDDRKALIREIERADVTAITQARTALRREPITEPPQIGR